MPRTPANHWLEAVRPLRFALLVALFVTPGVGWVGCGGGAPETYRVSGEVTYNGQPVNDGDILFLPVENRRAPAGGRVREGRFALEAPPGRCRVEITAIKITPETRYEMGAPLAANYLPARYNSESELTAEVTPDGANTFNYELTGP